MTASIPPGPEAPGSRDACPPRLARWILARCVPPGPLGRSVVGDLDELHARRAGDPRHGPRRADAWYWRHAVGTGLGYAWRRLRGRVPRGHAGNTYATTTGGGTMGGGTVGDVLQDIRFAWRGYRRTPGFLAVALLTLGLGVGANTAIFSVLNGLYLRPLPFAEPDRLVRIGITRIQGEPTMSVHTAGHFSAWRSGASSLKSMAAWGYADVTLARGDRAEKVLSSPVIGGLFEVLGVEAARGRVFTAAEEGSGAERLAVLSHEWAARAFGDEDPVGGTVRVDGTPYTVLGVMPPSFRYPHPTVAIWTTSALDEDRLLAHDDFFLRTVGRLAEGRTLDQARAELRRIFDDLRRDAPDVNESITASVIPLRENLTAGAGTLWGMLMAAVGLVLLIACLNLANLLMARASARSREMALRTSLGASRGRLVRQVLTESLVLAGLGGAVGVGCGWVLLEALTAWMPGGIPTSERVGLDGRVLAFAAGVSLLAGLAFGAVPAISSGRGSLREDAGGRRPGRSLVVAVEVGMAVVLLAAGGLTIRSFAALADRDPGLAVEDRYALSVELPADRDADERLAYYRRLEERLSAVPGVVSVASSSTFPVADFTPGAWVNAPDDARPRSERPTVKYQAVSPGYFETMGIPLLRGRLPDRGDGVDGTPSVVISRRAADELFGDEEALGRRFDLGLDGSIAPVSTVVGIVGDVRHQGLGREEAAAAYGVQELMPWWRGYQVLVHAPGGGAGLGAALRAAALEVDPTVALPEVRAVADVVSGSLASDRNTMLLFTLLAGVGLVMAAVGVFGVVAYVMSRRTREIGIRLAVGAHPSSVRRGMVGRALLPVLAGVAGGVAVAAAGGRVMESLLVDVRPGDPSTLAGVAVVLLVVAWVAIEVPVRRALKLDPSRVLSADGS